MIASLLLATRLAVDRTHVLARFDPRMALGATIDAHARGETAKIFTRENVEAMLSAGFQPLSYRLATELAGEAWHWNEAGTWSDAEHQRGYWTSSSESAPPITVSYGFRLPRRGNTIDQAHNDGYSRIDDGDRSTFWKSNPYLGERLQWVLVDLGALHPVDWIRIDWADPFAVDYSVQFWRGSDAINEPAEGEWITIGEVHDAHGGEETIRVAAGVPAPRRARRAPLHTRYVRVLMTRSSHTGVSSDWRDRVGFAVGEISVGSAGFDYVRHAPSHAHQSVIWVSSTDPWHRAIDLDESMEQAGLDTVFRSGLTRGLPMLTPVSILYGTPEDAAAEIRFLRGRGYSFTQIEMGEEPDGQNMSPEDYAALYLQWADAIHALDPSLRLGGPAFQSTRNVIAFWRDERGHTSWIGRFVDALGKRVNEFSFFSFEWYPFDDVCADPHQQLLSAPRILERVLAHWRSEGVPTTIPWIACEYGWSSYAAEPEIDMPAALFNAEFVAQFLSGGGAAAYVYGYEPEVIIREAKCPTFGNLLLFISDEDHHIRAKVPAYYAAQLVTHEWLLPSGTHELYAVRGTAELLRAFAVRRPDGTWAMLIVNKDGKPRRINVGRALARHVGLKPDLHVVQYWRRDFPPRRFRARDEIELPPQSLTVVKLTAANAVRATLSSRACRERAPRRR